MRIHRRRRTGALMSAAVIAGASLVTLVAVPQQAFAQCLFETWYSIPSHKGIFMWDGVTSFKDGPGGTMTGSVTKSRTVSTTVSASGSYSISGIITTVKVEVSSSATSSVTTTVGHTYSHNISAGKYGNLKYGSWGDSISWKRWRRNGDCTATVIGHGTARVANTAVGWKYWETNS